MDEGAIYGNYIQHIMIKISGFAGKRVMKINNCPRCKRELKEYTGDGIVHPRNGHNIIKVCRGCKLILYFYGYYRSVYDEIKIYLIWPHDICRHCGKQNEIVEHSNICSFCKKYNYWDEYPCSMTFTVELVEKFLEYKRGWSDDMWKIYNLLGANGADRDPDNIGYLLNVMFGYHVSYKNYKFTNDGKFYSFGSILCMLSRNKIVGGINEMSKGS